MPPHPARAHMIFPFSSVRCATPCGMSRDCTEESCAAELIWGARVVSGDEDGGDAGFGAGEDGFYSNTETETDSDTEGIEGFHGVRSRKTPRMHA